MVALSGSFQWKKCEKTTFISDDQKCVIAITAITIILYFSVQQYTLTPVQVSNMNCVRSALK